MNSTKKILTGTVLSLVVLMIGIMTYFSVKKISEKNERDEHLQVIPDFNLEVSENTYMSSRSKRNDNPLVIIYFNTECDYCETEAIEIVNSKNRLQELGFLFISTEDLKTIETFAESTGLSSLSNVISGRIEDHIAYDLLGITTVPQIFIYNSEGTLTKEFRGMTKIESLVRYANDK